MIAILDYNAGNLTSVKRALDFLQIPSAITQDPQALECAAGFIFPGVGAAGSAMRYLAEKKLDQTIKALVQAGKPMLGICLGCQIILDESSENNTRTLGILPGACRRFDPNLKDQHNDPLNIPHMGWNQVQLQQECVLFRGVPQDSEFYFVHSYYPVPGPDHVLGITSYGTEFCSVFGRDGLWAMQFHPEKSGRPGLKILSNFYAYCQETSNAQ